MYSRTLLDILFLIWGQTVADYKMLSFHLSINVIIIVVSFKILDLCPIALFQQLWNTLYILYALKLKLWLRSNQISKYFLLRNEAIDTVWQQQHSFWHLFVTIKHVVCLWRFNHNYVKPWTFLSMNTHTLPESKKTLFSSRPNQSLTCI